MTGSEQAQTRGLKPAFTPMGMWAFSIGTSIGWGSFIITCNTYLLKSGILGTVLGLLIGMAVIFVITWNLQYMIRKSPGAGGIYTFEKQVGSKDLGFLSFWFILLTYLAVLWANITSVPLFCRFFLGDTFQFGFHYSIFGYEVWFGEAFLSIGAVVLIGLLCMHSSKLPNKIMVVAALVFAVGFTACAVFALINHGTAYHYSPLYAEEGASAFGQIVRIAVISPWAFIGFENIAHFSEEYTFPVKRVRSILIWSVCLTTGLYILVSLLSVSAYPPEYGSWIEYLQDMGNLSGIKAVPAFYAAQHYLGQTGVVILMLALFSVILTSLIGNMMALSRLLYAAGKEGDAPRTCVRLNRKSIPYRAVIAVVMISVFIPFLGRTAIGWIVDVTTLGATMIYALLSYAVFRHAKDAGSKREVCTGIAGLVLMCIFLLLLLIPGLLPFHAMETESYALFIVWAILGLGVFRILVIRDKGRGYVHRVLVWLILLVMILFASMMWVSRATEHAAEEAVHEIFVYHESHPTDDSDEVVKEERVAFLEEEAKKISSTNILYTVVSLVLFVLSMSVILVNYRDNWRLGKQLDKAEEEKRAAERIAELKQSISSMMDNMPGLTFAKDAKTLAYIACNQAFAEYSHKDSPEGVIGLTAWQIFDPVTAKHFEEDDLMAMSMEEPYIYHEDVLDAEGNSRQLQTTKLKYKNEEGKLCILGMCQDVTDLVRVQRENALTKEAYEKAKRIGIIHTHIAETLASGYADMYYVNLETGEFSEYRTDPVKGMLKEERHGTDFFGECMTAAEIYVHPDDRENVIRSLDKEVLLDHLKRSGTFDMTYRLLTLGDKSGKNASTYVSMKVSRMKDDENFLIIAVADVNEEMKKQRATERMKEEHIAYERLNALSSNFLCVYIVDPETMRYREYSVGGGFELFAIPKEGTDFFAASREQIKEVIYPEDLDRFYKLFTREGVLSEIERTGRFTISYRLILNGKQNYVRLKAVKREEAEGMRIVVGVSDIDQYVRQEEEYARRLAKAQSDAEMDALTGIRNRYAYLNAEEALDHRIEEEDVVTFAIAILDVNDLKKVNDTKGHQAGDRMIKEACRTICNIFKHSPVYRVGGDEFAVIIQGEDYENLDTLLEELRTYNISATETGGIVIACGTARCEHDRSVAPVYERADHAMYENKSRLKAGLF